MHGHTSDRSGLRSEVWYRMSIQCFPKAHSYRHTCKEGHDMVRRKKRVMHTRCGVDSTRKPYERFFFAAEDPDMDVTRGRMRRETK
jgi:murein endopeptidase